MIEDKLTGQVWQARLLLYRLMEQILSWLDDIMHDAITFRVSVRTNDQSVGIEILNDHRQVSNPRPCIDEHLLSFPNS